MPWIHEIALLTVLSKLGFPWIFLLRTSYVRNDQAPSKQREFGGMKRTFWKRSALLFVGFLNFSLGYAQ